jgi:hypothetical protein
MKEGMTQDRVMPQFVITVPARPSPALGPSDVITGLVPVIPRKRSSALHSIGMAGTRPAMTGEGVIPDGRRRSRGFRSRSRGGTGRRSDDPMKGERF